MRGERVGLGEEGEKSGNNCNSLNNKKVKKKKKRNNKQGHLVTSHTGTGTVGSREISNNEYRVGREGRSHRLEPQSGRGNWDPNKRF